MPREASDLLHGTLDVLVLKTLSWGAMHGYAIVEWIEQRGSGDLVIVDAALYHDVATVQAGTLFAVFVVVTSQIVGDFTYMLLNPRIRFT